jgi:galactan endo-1,6-beta-galactosidase
MNRLWLFFLALAACGDAADAATYPPSSTNDPVSAPAMPAGAIRVNSADNHGKWEGWGTSLAWWANASGASAHQDVYADLFFSSKDVRFMEKTLPGLGLNIVRYNVGGGGRGDIPGVQENVPNDLPWYKDIDGYWLDWQSRDPASTSWDFTRDQNQRSMLTAARERGVDTVEFFSDAPMWWMTDTKSSAGGNLQAWNRADLARYVATVAQHARQAWGIDVGSVEAFNEPSAGWWRYPVGQEGCNIPKEAQQEVLIALRKELNARGLEGVAIAASDENTMTTAKTVYDDFKARPAPGGGTVADLIGKVNVHGYAGLNPWRDNEARKRLREAVGPKRLWMSEYGDADGSGMALAQTIMDDLVYLKPSAWIYWQVLEPFSGWGLVNGEYGMDPAAAERSKPKWVYSKYYVMAQFTRFLRAGSTFYGTSHPHTMASFDPAAKKLSLVTVTYENPEPTTYDLGNAVGLGAAAEITVTNTAGGTIFETKRVPIRDGRLTVTAEKHSVHSIVIPAEGIR